MSTFLETQVEKVAFDTPDNWELIKVIANMLSRDPRLSIKELVDNALGISETPNIRKHVRVIIRKKEKKDPHIKIVDNGSGWFVDGESSSTYYGKPNLHYTVKHIGDSVKNKFEVYRRAREEGKEVGQFGIGMLSFWALGGRLTVYTRGYFDGQLTCCSKMVWQKGVKEAEIQHDVAPPSELESGSGTVVIVDRLEKAQMTLITGTLLNQYLSASCRTLLIKTEALLQVDDHGSTITVRPKQYSGILFPLRDFKLSKGFGYVDLTIYVLPPPEEEDVKVSVFVKSAKVYEDITELAQLKVYPWNTRKVYGEINFPFGTIAPTRTSLVNDQFLDAFIEGMLQVTTGLADFLDSEEREQKARMHSKFVQQFRETWQRILQQLPEVWRRPPESPRIPGAGLAFRPSKTLPPEAVQSGPLAKAEISPIDPKVAVGTSQTFFARALDQFGNIINRDLIYFWEIIGSPYGLIKDPFGKSCVFEAGSRVGITTIRVKVFEHQQTPQGTVTITKSCSSMIYVVLSLPKTQRNPTQDSDKGKGDPPPAYDEAHMGEDGPHARFNKGTYLIEINDQHMDYRKARDLGDLSLYRYIVHCYAKEFAIFKWAGLMTDPIELSERIIELIAIAERMFDWKAIAEKPRGRPPKTLI